MDKMSFGKLTFVNERISDLKDQFIEMAQLKSNFDIEKFTVKREGHFVAHGFHFLMRQYHLALYEMRRMLYDREALLRKLAKYRRMERAGKTEFIIEREHGPEDCHVDIEIGRTTNEIDLVEVTMVNKIKMCEGFEAARKKLIELNGGKPPTNEQYQAEEPEYWKWFLSRKALWQAKQARTGIHEGVWENIDNLEQPALLTERFQVLMLDTMGLLDMEKLERNVETAKGIPERTKNIEAVREQLSSGDGVGK